MNGGKRSRLRAFLAMRIRSLPARHGTQPARIARCYAKSLCHPCCFRLEKCLARASVTARQFSAGERQRSDRPASRHPASQTCAPIAAAQRLRPAIRRPAATLARRLLVARQRCAPALPVLAGDLDQLERGCPKRWVCERRKRRAGRDDHGVYFLVPRTAGEQQAGGYHRNGLHLATPINAALTCSSMSG